jgi:hypothetical protein
MSALQRNTHTHTYYKGTHKMKLRQIASNMTELAIDNASILFSYETPVAGWDDDGAFETEIKYSVTTSKHITKYFGGKERRVAVARTVPQSYIDQLAGE